MANVFYGGLVQCGSRRHPAVFFHLKQTRKRLHRPFHPFPPYPPQLHQIIRSRNCNQQPTALPKTRRNSGAFILAVIDITNPNDADLYGISRSAFATIHSTCGYRFAATSTAGIEISTPCASHPVCLCKLPR